MFFPINSGESVAEFAEHPSPQAAASKQQTRYFALFTFDYSFWIC